MRHENGYVRHKCYVCGKEFTIEDGYCDDWVYRIEYAKVKKKPKTKPVCSWTCMRRFEKEQENESERKLEQCGA